MTEPTPTNLTDKFASLRGADNKTLSDIYDRLFLSLEVQNETLAAINTLTSRIQTLINFSSVQQGIISSQAVNLLNIAQSIGSIGQTPANYTVKHLLGIIQECLCEAVPDLTGGAGGEPSLPYNNEPLGLCGEFPASYRIYSTQFVANTIVGGITYKIYSPLWAPGGGWEDYIPMVTTASGRKVHLLNIPRARVCVSWNFAGTTMLGTYGRILSGSADGADIEAVNTFSLATPTGSKLDDIVQSNAGERYLSYRFAVPETVSFPPNVWLHVIPLTVG